MLDLDDIAVRLGSPTKWKHPPEYLDEAEDWMRVALRRLTRSATTAYIIRCAPHPGQRARLARALNATVVVVVLNPGQTECIRRARTDRRPRGTESAIRWWYRTYRPSEVDTPCPAEHPAPASPAAR